MKNKKAAGGLGATLVGVIITVAIILVLLVIFAPRILDLGKESVKLGFGETCAETGKTAEEYNLELNQNIYLGQETDALETYSKYKLCFSISEHLELDADEDASELALWLCGAGRFQDSKTVYDLIDGEDEYMETQCLALGEISSELQNNQYISAKEKADEFALFSLDPIPWYLLIAEAKFLGGNALGAYNIYQSLLNHPDLTNEQALNIINPKLSEIYLQILSQKFYASATQRSDFCFKTDNRIQGISNLEIKQKIYDMFNYIIDIETKTWIPLYLDLNKEYYCTYEDIGPPKKFEISSDKPQGWQEECPEIIHLFTI